MNKRFSDELISAYLDGELTADEQAEVERALLDSADYRRMFDELRALRQSLQALPRYQLDADFSQRVLRRAERAMLAGEAGGDTQPAGDIPPPPDTTIMRAAAKQAPDSSAPATPSLEFNRQALELKRWRRISWASVTVAAASLLLAAVFSLRGGLNQNIARSDFQRNGDSWADHTSSRPQPSVAPATSPFGMTSSEALEDRLSEFKYDTDNVPTEPSGDPPLAEFELPAGLGGALPATPLARTALNRDELRGGTPAGSAGTGVPDSRARSQVQVSPAAGAGLAAPKPTIAGKPQAPSLGDKADAVVRDLERVELKAVADHDRSLALKQADGDEPDATYFSSLYDANVQGVQVVRLTLTPAEFRSGLLDKVLANHHITLLEPRAETEAAGLGEGKELAAIEQLSRTDADSNRAEAVEASSVSSDLDIVLVDAPAAQLDAAMRELTTRVGVISDPSAAPVHGFSFLAADFSLRTRGARLKSESGTRDQLELATKGRVDGLAQPNPAKLATTSPPAALGGGGGGGGLEFRKAGAAPGGERAPTPKDQAQRLAVDEKAAQAKNADGDIKLSKDASAAAPRSRAAAPAPETQDALGRRLMRHQTPVLEKGSERKLAEEFDRSTKMPEASKKLPFKKERAGQQPAGDDGVARSYKMSLAKDRGRTVRVLFLIQVAEPVSEEAAAAAPAPHAPDE